MRGLRIVGDAWGDGGNGYLSWDPKISVSAFLLRRPASILLLARPTADPRSLTTRTKWRPMFDLSTSGSPRPSRTRHRKRVADAYRRTSALIASLVCLLATGHARAFAEEIAPESIESEGSHRAPSAPDVLPASISIEALERRALERHPSLGAFDARVRAVREEAQAARTTLPAPEVGYTFAPLAMEMPGGVERHMFMVSQSVPIVRRLRQAEQTALAWIPVLDQEQHALERDLVLQVRLWAIELARVDAITVVVRERQALVEDAIEHLDGVLAYDVQRYREHLDLAMRQELLHDRVARLRMAREAAEVELARAIGDPVDDDLHRYRVDPDDPVLLVDVALGADGGGACIEAHPRLRRLDAESHVQVEQAELLRMQRAPMPMFVVNYGVVQSTPASRAGHGHRSPGTLSFGVRIELPVFRRSIDASMRARMAAVDGLSARASDVQAELERELAAASVAWNDAVEQLERLEGRLMPLADDLAEAILIDIEVGRSDHVAYLMALDRVLELRERVVDVRAAAAVARARISSIEGTEHSAESTRCRTHGGSR